MSFFGGLIGARDVLGLASIVTGFLARNVIVLQCNEEPLPVSSLLVVHELEDVIRILGA